MADSNKDNVKVPSFSRSGVNKLEKNIQDNIDRLYSDVKGNSPEVSRTIDYMRTKMHKSIDAIINNNIANTGLSNVSSLISRVKGKEWQKDGKVINSIIKTFEDDSIMNNVMSIYSQNVYLKEMDKEIDVVCKYMPKLLEALDVRKEAVLSADHFTKDSINIKSTSADISDISAENNIAAMKEKYDLSNILDRVYAETDKYGECFVYCVPYRKALERILDKSNKIPVSNEKIISEEAYFTYNESTQDASIHINPTNQFVKDNSGLMIELNTSGVLESAVMEYKKADEVYSNIPQGLNVIHESNPAFKRLADKVNGTAFKKALYQVDSQDGFIDASKSKNKENKITVPGCVLKVLDHTMVRPIRIEDNILGYYYIECDHELNMESITFSSTLGGLKPGQTARKLHGTQTDADKEILRKIAKQISDHIDSKFINANQDLTKEIYMILKYNMDVNDKGRISKIRVSFLPPEGVVHSYFKLDPKTNRGVSALQRALFPAKLYSCLYISNVITILTRGNDKRVYYVKQNVDTNISGVLLNTIMQIKRSNFGLRQIENMNNLMNITGRFNDYVIPESQSGDAPVRFEIMEGQKIEVQTELMQSLEEMSVNSTDVPIEVIQARRQLDFATHYTMSNTRFLRVISNLQAKFTKICNQILTRIYDAEFECDDLVEVELPPPMYLNLMNINQLQQNATETTEFITPMYYDTEAQTANPVEVARFKAEVKKFYMKSFIPDKAIKRIKDKVSMEIAKETSANAAGVPGSMPGQPQGY